MANRVVHFEIHAPEPEKFLDFYILLFGWQAEKWGDEQYWQIITGPGQAPGIDGAVMKSRDGQPRVVNTIQVDSVDEYAERVPEAGGEVVVSKMAIPGVGYVIYCSDPGGAIFGLFQSDSQAE